VTLQPPVLDDLDWARMVEAILRRVPAESDGTWTLHAPVDPGITLLELFAYLLEQRLYRLDEVPDELVLAVLRLLGLDGPRPAQPAGTVLRLAAQHPDQPTPLVPAGTVFARDPLQRVAFTVENDTTVLPFTGQVMLWTDGADRTADLLARRPVALLPRTGGPAGGPAEARIVLPLAAPVRPARGAAVSLLVELTTPIGCPAAWLPTAVAGVPPPARLAWSWYRPDPDDPARGRELPALGPQSVADGTAGLRRSGVLRLPLPDDWCAGGEEPAPDRYGLRVHTPAATYSTAPTVTQLAPNVTVARHRRTLRVTEADLADQLRAWLRLPGQHLDLPGARGLLLAATVRLTRDGVAQKWTEVADRTFAGPADRVFVLDRDVGAVRFGDGLNGAVPVVDTGTAASPGAGAGGGAAAEPLVRVDYEIGGGTAGNGGLTGNWTLLRDGRPTVGADPDLVAAAQNLVPAEGGVEAESLAAVRARIGDSLGEVTRAVTAADFLALATTTPGVAIARCHVGIGDHPRYPCSAVPGAVTVRIVPGVPDPVAALADPGYDPALAPDPGAVRVVTARLRDARLLGTEVFVRPPLYRQVALRVELSGAPSDSAGVRDAVRAALRRLLDPLLGGDEGDGWPFGEPLRPSALLRVAQDAAGDRAQVEQVAVGLDGAVPAAGCDDVPLGPGRLPALRGVRVRTVAAAPGQAAQGDAA
jgi:predicted phage baseplate assembly protein